jgi:O-antigen/teichoic acid export membrane protein
MEDPQLVSGSTNPWRRRQLSRLLVWGERGFSAVLERGLVAISNFVLNVFLARWLLTADYGTFAVVYSTFALLATLHGGFLEEPLLVFGSGRYANDKSRYLGTVLNGQRLFVAGLSTILVAGALAGFLFPHPTATALLGLAVATPFILYRQLGRTATYMILNPRLAVFAAVLYMGLMLPGVFLVYRAGWLSSAMAFLLMGLASLISALWLFHRLGPTRVPIRNNPLTRDVLGDHWNYGRWAAATGILVWIPGQIYYFALSLSVDLNATAQLRVAMTLIMPASAALSAISTLFVPALVRLRSRDYFRRVLVAGMALFTLLAALYWLILGLFSQPILLWLYGERYVDVGPVIWIVGLVPILTGSVTVLGPALRALERPDLVFWAHALSSAATVTIGLALMTVYGLEGAAFGMVAAYATTALTMTWFLFVGSGKQADFASPQAET